jgi:hypothetical protein
VAAPGLIGGRPVVLVGPMGAGKSTVGPRLAGLPRHRVRRHRRRRGGRGGTRPWRALPDPRRGRLPCARGGRPVDRLVAPGGAGVVAWVAARWAAPRRAGCSRPRARHLARRRSRPAPGPARGRGRRLAAARLRSGARAGAPRQASGDLGRGGRRVRRRGPPPDEVAAACALTPVGPRGRAAPPGEHVGRPSGGARHRPGRRGPRTPSCRASGSRSREARREDRRGAGRALAHAGRGRPRAWRRGRRRRRRDRDRRHGVRRGHVPPRS